MATLIVNDVSPRTQYTATGGQTVFPYPFPIFDDTDLLVYLTPNGSDADDATDILVLTTDYTVSGAGDSAGGNVTLVNPATAGDIVTIVRDVPIARTSDYQTAGDLLAETLNDDFDKLAMMLQQVESYMQERSFLFQNTVNLTGIDVNAPNPVADGIIKWNAAANALEAVDLSTFSAGALVVSAFVETLLNDADGDAFLATLDASLTEYLLTKTHNWYKGSDITPAALLQPGDGNYFDVTYNALISGITQANPGVVTTSAAHGLSNGELVTLSGVVGMTEVNDLAFTVANVTSTTFELSGVNTSAYTAYSSGGVVCVDVNGFDDWGQNGTVIKLHFDHAVYLNHSVTNMALPGERDLIAVAGDEFEFTRYGTYNWRCTGYKLANGKSADGDFFVTASDGAPVIRPGVYGIGIESSLTKATWTTIGPTGSGATYIDTDLDDLPDDINWIEVKIFMKLAEDNGTANANMTGEIRARNFGATASDSIITKIAAVNDRLDASGLGVAWGVSTHKIPVTDKKFELYWTNSMNASGTWYPGESELHIVGYGY